MGRGTNPVVWTQTERRVKRGARPRDPLQNRGERSSGEEKTALDYSDFSDLRGKSADATNTTDAIKSERAAQSAATGKTDVSVR